jgi:mercuric ion transport protein
MMEKTPLSERDGRGLLGPLTIGGAGVLALLSASCCVLPIGLSILGLGGTWLAALGPFVAYRPVILLAVGGVLVWATLRLVRRPPCRGRRAGTLAVFGFALLAFAASLTAPMWEGQAQSAMWALWQESKS